MRMMSNNFDVETLFGENNETEFWIGNEDVNIGTYYNHKGECPQIIVERLGCRIIYQYADVNYAYRQFLKLCKVYNIKE